MYIYISLQVVTVLELDVPLSTQCALCNPRLAILEQSRAVASSSLGSLRPQI